jgi:uncharacterized protein YbbK (DUF523 family)
MKFRDTLNSASGGCGEWERCGAHRRASVVVSRCLTGDRCRYDGAVLEYPMVERLNEFLDMESVCPEMEIGLPVPRKPLNVISSNEGPRLIETGTGADLTERIRIFSEKFSSLVGYADGLIMKDRSPSCGIGNTPLKKSGGNTVSGFFSSLFMEEHPRIAATNIEDLQNRDNLIQFLRLVLNRPARECRSDTPGTFDPAESVIRENSRVISAYILGGN